MLSSKDAEYKLAQSGDATCNGLDSAEVSIFQAPIQHGPGAPFLSLPVFTCHFHLTALRKKIVCQQFCEYQAKVFRQSCEAGSQTTTSLQVLSQAELAHRSRGFHLLLCLSLGL